MLRSRLHPKRKLVFSILVFSQVFISNNLVSCYDNALLRNQVKDLFPSPKSINVTHHNGNNTTDNGTAADFDSGTSPDLLNSDYELEPDTNKTKRSKAALRWLQSALGLGSGAGESATGEPETEGQTEMSSSSDTDSSTAAPGSSILTSIVDPFHIKRKIASKVSTVYQTVAGAVGIGGGGGGGPAESTDGESSDSENSGTKAAPAASEDDESAGSRHSCHFFLVIFAGYLSVGMHL